MAPAAATPDLPVPPDLPAPPARPEPPARLCPLARLAPQRLVYVSCHAGSLARDLGILVAELGFSLQAAGIVDMFTHTSHVESVAVLDSPGS